MYIPPSKSQSMRAVLFEHLSKKKCYIKNILNAPEVQAFISTLKNWDNTEFVDVKNSGIALHFLIALSALRETTTIIDGDTSIQTLRPITPLIDALRSCGVEANYLKNEGFAPVSIKGPLKPAKVELIGKNSQHVSALLIALSLIEGQSTICVIDPCETPYVQMTIDWLKKFGSNVSHENYNFFRLDGPIEVKDFSYEVPLDFSSASFILLVSKLFDLNYDFGQLDFKDAQGDKKIFELLDSKSCSIKDTPDLLPILMVAGVLGVGPTRIEDIHVARQKESDRPQVMQKELQKMGANIDIFFDDDYLLITPTKLHGACLLSYKDHRIAMSLAVAALKAEGESILQGVECVAKSFPNFFETYCPDWIAEIRKIDSGTISICPNGVKICRLR